MPISFLGFIGARPGSELEPTTEPLVDKAYAKDLAQAHEQSGFDRVLVGYLPGMAETFMMAAYAGFVTERLGILLAHRPGFVSPTLAARKLATLDHYIDGRLAMHTITGGDDGDQQSDGDFLPKEDRYRRSDEYLTVVKLCWSSDVPFDFDGEFYRVRRGQVGVRPLQVPRIPIYFGGASDAAGVVSAKHADVHMLFGEPLADIASEITRIRINAEAHGNHPEFSVSLRPILGATEGEAWDNAYAIRDALITRYKKTPGAPQAASGQRLLDAASRAEIHDTRLWTPLAAITGARGNSTALVGTAQQIADAIVEYHRIGVRHILIRGYRPLEDTRAYGEIVELTKAAVQQIDAGAPT